MSSAHHRSFPPGFTHKARSTALRFLAVKMAPSLPKDKKNKVERFRNTTNSSETTARSYLERFSWDIMRAVDEFYSNGGDDLEEVEDDNSVSVATIEQWFDQYADPDEEDTITEEGVVQFCEDIGVDLEDIVVLVIAWKMEAALMGTFTKKEWTQGMKALRCDSVDSLKAQIPKLRQLIDNDRDFKPFYSFCFAFSKEAGQRSLGIEIATPMWELLLKNRYPKLTTDWLAFLNEKNPCKGVTRDTWDLLLDFFVKVQESYGNYDENEAWPVLIDDFMTWIETTGKK